MEIKSSKDEKIPIAPPLKVLEHATINKKFGWWSAVVLLESWGRKQLCFYLWQKRADKWKRKQKYTIHSQERWRLISESIEELIDELQ